jgi:hypothetical protein
MMVLVEQLHPGALISLREDPIAELQSWPEIQVLLVPEADGVGRCSVTGSYQDSTQPPTLVVGMARSRRRRGFTGLHELGHHLQQTDMELGQRVFAYGDSEAFEEAACDAFAARVLLPDDQVAGCINPRGPTALDVVAMFQKFRASREACCVRAAEYLTGAGVVVLLDATGTVIFAAPRGAIPPARGSNQSGTPLIEAALRGSATVERDQTYVAYRDGSSSDLLYGQAAWCDEDYLVAVLAVDNAPWRAFAPPRPGTGRFRSGSWWTCETCEDEFRVTEAPCERCGEPRCSDGHCRCTVARTKNDRRCDRCFLILPPSRFEGTGSTCCDCR